MVRDVKGHGLMVGLDGLTGFPNINVFVIL